jgi:hypothetical protein
MRIVAARETGLLDWRGRGGKVLLKRRGLRKNLVNVGKVLRGQKLSGGLPSTFH